MRKLLITLFILMASGQAWAQSPIIHQTVDPVSPNCISTRFIYGDTSNNLFVGQNNGNCTKFVNSAGMAGASLFTSTASAANDHIASDTSLVGTGVGSTTTAANYFSAGTNLKIELSGIITTAGTPDTLDVKIKATDTTPTTVVVGDTGAVTPSASLTNQAVRLVALITCRTTGSSGTFIINTILETTGATLTAPNEYKIVNTSTVTLDTTKALTWDVTAAWGGTTAGDVITGTNFTMYTPGSGSGGSGTVTSVALSLPSTLLTVTGSPVTSSGTLTGALATHIDLTSATDIKLPGLTTVGSIPFAGTGGVVAQDNANLFWDATNHRLGIGTTTPAVNLVVNGASNPQARIISGDTNATVMTQASTTTGRFGVDSSEAFVSSDNAGKNFSVYINPGSGVTKFADFLSQGNLTLNGISGTDPFYIKTAGSSDDAAVVIPNADNQTSVAYGVQDAAATNWRWYVSKSGVHNWGPAGSSVDTNLYRLGVGILATDNNLSLTAASGAILKQFTNDGTTGTGTNLIVKLNGNNQVVKVGTSDTEALGICVSGCSTTGSAQIAISGTASCVFDNTSTAGHYVQISTGTAGDCHDAGSSVPTSGGTIIGKVSAGGTAGTHQVAMLITPPGSTGGTGCTVSGSAGAVFNNGSSACTTDTNITTDSSGNETLVSVTTSGSNGGISGTEGTGAGLTAGAGTDLLYPDSTLHGWKMNNNNGGAIPVVGGPTSATGGNLASFNGTTGGIIADSGVVAANVNTNSSSFTNNNLVKATGNHTTADAGIAAANVVTAAANYTSGNLVKAAASDKTTSDSGIAATNVVTNTTGNAAATNQIIVAGSTDKTVKAIDFPDVKIIPAANCNNATGGAGWSIPATNNPTVECFGGTNNLGGDLLWANNNTTTNAQFAFELPLDWDTSTQPYIKIRYGSGSNTSGTVKWTFSSACTKSDGSVTTDPAFNAESASTGKTMAAATRMWAESVQFTAITSGNNCVAGSYVIVKVTSGNGTATSAVRVFDVQLTIPRLLVVQGN